jgi:hypothetical protein
MRSLPIKRKARSRILCRDSGGKAMKQDPHTRVRRPWSALSFGHAILGKEKLRTLPRERAVSRSYIVMCGLPMLFPSLFPVSGRSSACVGSGIANGGPAPFRMAPFPPVKSSESDVVADKPRSSGPQVHVRAAHHPYIFVAVPNIRVGHAYCHLRHRWRNVHHGRSHRNRAASGQRGSESE